MKKGGFVTAAALFMLLCGGVSFPLVKIGLGYADPLPLLAVRFGTGAVAIFLVFALREWRRGGSVRAFFDGAAVKSGLLCGLICGAGMILQVVGLTYTTAAKGAFINNLYAVLIPVVGALFFRVRPNLRACLGLAGAAVGMLIFSGVVRIDGGLSLSLDGLNVGDLLVFLAAVCFAVQLNIVSRRRAEFDPLAFSGWQGVAIALLPLILWLLFQPDAHAEFGEPAMLWILFVIGPLGSGISMSAQILVQTRLPGVQAALIYVLGPVLSALFAAVIPDRTGAVEPITLQMVIGGLVILGSILSVKLSELRREGAGAR